MAESTNEVQEDSFDPELMKQLEQIISGHTPTIAEKGMKAIVHQNDATNPAPYAMIDAFYAGVFSNTLGIMIAKHKPTGMLVPVLMGTDDMGNVYPLAACLSPEVAASFLPPDGKGGYIEQDGDNGDETIE